jgi:predicted membrane-bound spermidine synthase
MDYPVDHARTTRAHAGETMKNTANMPGLVAVAVAVVSLSIALYELATSNLVIATVAVLLALVAGVAGSGWLIYSHRRVRRAEQQLVAMGSNDPAPPPSS